jgi:hypothetical protein
MPSCPAKASEGGAALASAGGAARTARERQREESRTRLNAGETMAALPACCHPDVAGGPPLTPTNRAPLPEPRRGCGHTFRSVAGRGSSALRRTRRSPSRDRRHRSRPVSLGAPLGRAWRAPSPPASRASSRVRACRTPRQDTAVSCWSSLLPGRIGLGSVALEPISNTGRSVGYEAPGMSDCLVLAATRLRRQETME